MTILSGLDSRTPPAGGDLDEWLRYLDKTEAADDLVDGLFDPFGTILIGQPFVGKTWLALNIAAALASGADTFLDRKLRPSPHGVAYVGTDPGSLQRAASRLRDMGVSGEARRRIRLERLPAHPDAASDWSTWWYHQRGNNVGVVILDNLFGASDERADVTSTSGALPLVNRLGDLVSQGAAVLAVGHTSKPSGSSGAGRTTYGSQVYDAFFRRRVAVEKTTAGDVLRLVVKSNDSPDLTLGARQDEQGRFQPAPVPSRQRSSSPSEPAPRRQRASDGDVLAVVQALPEGDRANDSQVARALVDAGLAKTQGGGRNVWNRVKNSLNPTESGPGT